MSQNEHLQAIRWQRNSRKIRYAVCGLSSRAIRMFVLPFMDKSQSSEYGDFSEHGELVGLLDSDQKRLQSFNDIQETSLPAYSPDSFSRMIDEANPDVVIVASPDGSHADYIVEALKHNLNVITEKPMVIDCEQARAVIEAESRSRGLVRVAHNSRYRPAHVKIKQMIEEGLLGRITNVELVWNIDTYHGSSYFYRWNRERAKSGGLTVSKGCHHFDLINWWLDDVPEQVFSYGALNYYGANSPYNPNNKSTQNYSVEQQKERCPYYQSWNTSGPETLQDDHLTAHERVFKLPYWVQYPQDEPQYIYDEEIAIEDTYSTVVRYRGGTTMAYSANFSAPWEGYTLGINGTRGRLETTHYTEPSRCPFPVSARQSITYYPLFGERQVHDTQQAEGEHGGSDRLIKEDLFMGPSKVSQKLDLKADSMAGAYAVAVGEATWRSLKENRPIDIQELLGI